MIPTQTTNLDSPLTPAPIEIVMLGVTLLLLILMVSSVIVWSRRRNSGAESRRITTLRWVGIGIGVMAWVWLGGDPFNLGDRRGQLLPGGFALPVIALSALGELLIRPGRGGERVASLRPRRAFDHISPGLVATVGTAVLLGSLSVAVATVAVPGLISDLLPALASLILCTAAATLTIRLVAERPRGGSTQQALLHRARATRAAVAALGVALTGTVATVCTWVGTELIGAGRAQFQTDVGTIALAVGLATFAVTIWCLAIVVAPGNGIRSSAPVAAHA